jgi:hypothetical protein
VPARGVDRIAVLQAVHAAAGLRCRVQGRRAVESLRLNGTNGIEDMTTLPTRRRHRTPVAKADKRDVAARASSRPALTNVKPVFAFRYSFTALSTSRGNASLTHRETSFENGTLTSETFEGSVDRPAYEELVARVHEQMLRQTQMVLRSMFWFLPGARRDRGDED